MMQDCGGAMQDARLYGGGAADTEIRLPPMFPPWGLMLTRPGETAISAGAMFRPCGETLTPVGDTEMRVCAHRHHSVRPEAQTACPWQQPSKARHI